MSEIALHVAPSGSDTNAGTMAHPLSSLQGARDAVRRLLAEGRSENIRVEFQTGTYPTHETVVWDRQDSARAGQTIRYCAGANQTPVFSAGLRVSNWKLCDEAIPDLPATAQGHIWTAPLPDGVKTCRVLYDGTVRLDRAAEPYFEHLTPLEPSWRFQGTREEHLTVVAPQGRIKAWPYLADVEVVIRGMAPWNMNILGIDSVDVEASTFRLKNPTTYVVARPGGCVIENTFRGLDAPGKWMVDSKARRLYLWPRKAKPGDDITAPTLVEMIRVEGQIDYEGPSDVPVRGIVFQGLTFQQNDRPTMRGGLSGWGLQHDWDDFDAPTAMIRFRGAEDCAVEDCRLVHGGSAGIRLDLHARRIRVVRNEIADLGGTGILLAGYGPGTKHVNRENEVAGNSIHEVGRLFWHSPGIFVWQSGENRIAENRLYALPYSAIVVSGRIQWDRTGVGECSRTIRWHELGSVTGAETWQVREPFLHGRNNRIEANDISDVMQILGDGNGIYISGTGGGNHVVRNYIHDCLSPHFGECIRCDDDQHETLIEVNQCVRFGGMSTGICSKGVNHILNNLIAFPTTPTLRGLISIELTPSAGSRIQGNVLYALRKDQSFYYINTYYPNETPPHIRDMDMDLNLYFNREDPDAGTRHLAEARTWGKDLHSLSADPLLVDNKNGSYRLHPDSPARKLEFPDRP